MKRLRLLETLRFGLAKRLLLVALWGLLSGHSVYGRSGSDYFVPEAFDTAYVRASSLSRVIPLGDGSSFLQGNFNFFEDELTGLGLLVRSDGKLVNSFSEILAYDVEVLQMAALEEGGYSMLFRDSGSGGRYFARVGPSGEPSEVMLLEDIEVVGLTADGGILAMESEFIETANGFENFYGIGKLAQSGSDGWVLASDFEPILVAGPNMKSQHVAFDGSIYLLGSFTQVGAEEQINGRLLKFDSRGELVRSFAPDGISETSAAMSEPELVSLANGDVFLYSAEPGQDELFRLSGDGAIDQDFVLDGSYSLHGVPLIASIAGGGYYFLDGAPVRFDREGKLEEGFSLDVVGAGFEEGAYLRSAALPSGELFVMESSGESELKRSAVFDADGDVVETDEYSLGRMFAPISRWTPSGELLFERADSNGAPEMHDIAHVDGSVRQHFSGPSGIGSIALIDGGLATKEGVVYLADGTLRKDVGFAENVELVGQLADGRWIAVAEEEGGYNDIVLLRRSGARDPSFTPFRLSGSYDLRVWPFDAYFYLAATKDVQDAAPDLLRLFYDGALDSGFSAPILSDPPSQVMDTGRHVYLAPGKRDLYSSNGFFVSGVLKEFGARLDLDGSFDESYAPELELGSYGQLDREHKLFRAFAADGSSIQLGFARNPDGPGEAVPLYYLDPEGRSSLIESGWDLWKEGYIDVAPDGRFVVSGTLDLIVGTIDVSIVFTPYLSDASLPGVEREVSVGSDVRIEATLLGEREGLRWMLDGEPVSGSFEESLVLDSWNKDSPELVELVGGNGTERRLLASVRLTPPPIPVIDEQTESTELAYGDSATLGVWSYAGAKVAYQWFRDGQLLLGETERTLSINPDSTEDIGMYQVRVRNEVGEVWTDPARVTAQGLWPVNGRFFDLGSYQGSGSAFLSPAPGGGFRLRMSSPSNSTDASIFDRVRTDGTVEEDPLSALELEDQSFLVFSNRVPRAFVTAYRLIKIDDEYLYQLSISRLRDDGEIDAGFGEQEVLSYQRILRIAEFEDGTVWLETDRESIAVTPAGEASPLGVPKARSLMFYALSDRWSVELPDGRWLLREQNLGGYYILDTEDVFHSGKPVYSRYSGDLQLLGIWGSGNALYLNSTENTLVSVDMEGNLRWNVPLGDVHLDIVAPEESVAARSADETRIYLVAHRGENPIESFVFSVSDGGVTSLGQGEVAIPFEANFQGIRAGQNEDLVCTFSSADKFGQDELGYTVLNFETKEFATGFPRFYTRSQVARLVYDRLGEARYIVHSGTHIEGEELGPVVRLLEQEGVDSAFSIEPSLWDAIREEGYASMYLALDGERLVRLFRDSESLELTFFSKDGSALASHRFDDVYGDARILKEDSEGRTLLAWSTATEARIERFLPNGERDSTMGLTIPISAGYVSGLEALESGYIYLHVRNVDGEFTFIKISDTGEVVDPRFYVLESWGSGPFRAGPTELLVVDGAIKRINEAGEVVGVYQGSNAFGVSAFSNGDIFADNKILSKTDGNVLYELGQVFGIQNWHVAGNRLLLEVQTEDGLYGYKEFAPTLLSKIVSLPRSRKAALGESVTLGLEMDTQEAIEVQWYKEGALIDSADGMALVLPRIEVSDFGAYTARVQIDSGSVWIPSFELVRETDLEGVRPRALFMGDEESASLTWNRNDHFDLKWSKDLVRWESFGGLREFLDGSVQIDLSHSFDGSPLFFRFEAVE